jgi:hypothetical protein
MKNINNTIIILIFVGLILVCMIYDNTLMNEPFFAPISSPRVSASASSNNNTLMGGARVKSAHELMQSERKLTSDHDSSPFLSSNNRILTAAAAVAMLNSSSLPDKKRYRAEMIEGFETSISTPTSTINPITNPTKSNCLLPLPLANNNTNKNNRYAPTEYNSFGKPDLFDMVEQPINPKYPMLVLP